MLKKHIASLMALILTCTIILCGGGGGAGQNLI